MPYEYKYENYEPLFPDQPMVDLYLPVWARLPRFRSKPAFIWVEDMQPTTHLSLSYEQLNASVDAICCGLLGSLQVQRGDTVLLLCSPGLHLVELLFGCQRAGLLSVPMIPPKQNYEHLKRAISETKPKAVIADPHYISTIGDTHTHTLQSIPWISIDQVKQYKGKVDSLTYSGCNADEVYLVQYTSGATGVPKPVLVTAGSAAHNVRTARKAYDLHPNSRIVSWLPQYHDCGLMFLLLTIVSGATCVLTSPSAFVKRPRLWLELLSEFKATCTPVPSFALPLVIKRGGIHHHQPTSPINLSPLKNLIIINEPIHSDSVQEFLRTFSPFGLAPSSISPSYGLAENCTFVSTAWRSDSVCSTFPTHNKLLPVARLGNMELEDMEIMIVNEETLEAVEDGIEGEIWVASPSNASGYLGHPCLTRHVFHARLRNVVSKCFLRTGDRGIVKGEKRYLFVTGRCQDVMELQNGLKVHPHYIETAAYNTCTNFLRGGCLAAFKVSATVVLLAEIRRLQEDVDTGLLKRICEGIKEGVWKKEKVEVGWVVLVETESVPKTTSGKLKRGKAREKLLAGELIILMEIRFGKDVKTTQNPWEDNLTNSLLSAQTPTTLISLL
ncbi:hypothetical protein VNO78_00407 [Psophocarpus tetragonolobus]|uniref:AMP-dependent synthetase/ligase domain-containing protein n=1 Tax=Psophocarpus tetragonolobus TaxID=3891 RepID=A0AAN9XUL1_PSOTE